MKILKEKRKDIMEKKSFMTKGWVVCILAFICSALWGSAFPCIKIGYEMFDISVSDTASQIYFAGLRFTLAGVLALILGSIMQKKPLVFTRKQLPKIALLSLFQTVLQYLLFYIGLAHTTGANASIDEAANVFVVILISALLFRQEKLTAKKMLGCGVGFAGIIIINLSGMSGGFEFSLLGDGFVLLSTVAYGFSSVFMKKWSDDNNPVMMSAWQFVFGGLLMTFSGVIMGGRISNVTLPHISMLLYLAFISAAAYSLWATLLKYNPVSRVSVYGFMNPVIGVILSSLLLNESKALGLSAYIALMLVCIGIFIVSYKNEK